MKKALIAFYLLFSLTFSKAQNATIDSLRAVANSGKEDTNTVNAMSLLSYELLNTNTDSAIYYAGVLKTLSEKLNYNKGITASYFRLGQAYNNLGDYGQSQSNLTKALELSTDKSTTAKIYVNIGINLWEMGNLSEALKNYLTGLKAFEETGDRRAIGSTYNNIGIIYNEMGKNEEALKYHQSALKIREENNDKRGIAGSCINIGVIHFEQGNYQEALKKFGEAKKLYEEIDDKYGLALAYSHTGLIYKNQGKYEEGLENYFAALKIQEEAGDREGVSISNNSIGIAYLDKGQPAVGKKWMEKGLAIATEMGVKIPIRDSYQALARADSALKNYKDALANYQMYILYRDSILNNENTEKIVRQKMQYDFDKKETEAKAKQEVTQKELQRQKLVRNGFMGGFAVMMLFAVVFLRQRNKIRTEKKRSDKLLLNILPEEVAAEIKSSGKSKAKTFSMVTVMFTDFKDFTTVSQKVSAELLVAELDYCFSAFDNIIQKYKIEKIKTVGDAYLCASGMPVSSFTHATDMVQAAIEIRDFMLVRKKEKESKGEIPFELRIGIHTGPVVAGIVGVKKYAYDIWGDTVNLAARMEQNSEVGKINISGSTFELVKNQFKCSYRGKIEAKNKGSVDMYYAEKI